MRSTRGVVWPYLLLSVALLGALGFGWVQTRQKNQLALQAENKYMAAFHRLKWTSENIEERTARLMATNDLALQQSLLADIRVFSAQAVENMSGLPLANMNTPKITNFLNTLRERSDEYHYKLNLGTPLSPQEWDSLAELRKQAVYFENELANLAGLVGSNMIRWRDTARVTGPAQSGKAVTPITRSVLQMDGGLPVTPGEEAALAPGRGPLARPKSDLGPKVGPAEAAAAILRFIDEPLKAEPKLTGQPDPNDRTGMLTLYFFDAQKANGTPLSFGVSTYGGHIVFMIDGRPVRDRQFTREQLVDRARQMLRRWGYATADFVSAMENDGTQVMAFAPRENGVTAETDLVKVSLAMDNAELVGFDARNYWVNRHERTATAPRLSAAEAKTRLSPRLLVQGDPTLTIVADRRGSERLTWKFVGQFVDQWYHVYVDALNGQEVNVLRIAGKPPA